MVVQTQTCRLHEPPVDSWSKPEVLKDDEDDMLEREVRGERGAACGLMVRVTRRLQRRRRVIRVEVRGALASY